MAAAAPTAGADKEFEIGTEGEFDAKVLLAHLEDMSKETKDIHWRPFTLVCAEITKLVSSMGSVFHFAASDVQHNVGVMCNQYRAFNKEAGEKPGEPGSAEGLGDGIRLTVDYAIAREARDKTFKQNDKKYIAITFTVRHLLWTLDFVHATLSRLMATDDAAKAKEMAQIVREAYADSLSQYHGFMLRQTMSAACAMLPYRAAFIKSIGSGRPTAETMETLTMATALIRTCKEAVWDLYRKRSIVPE